MKTSESIKNVAAALLKVQRELEPIKKDRENTHFHHKYATLDAITERVVEVLNKHGLLLVQGGGERAWENSGMLVETRFIHPESNEWIASTVELPLAKADPQGAGSAITYGRRYGLLAALGITTEDDDDAQTVSQPVRQLQSVAAQTGHRQPPPPVPAFAARAAEVAACPKCGSDMWDNRKDKKNPKAPDFKCKDRSCDGVIWPPKPGDKPATQHVGPGLNDRQPEPTENNDDDLPF
jgi:hypothetical protein